jgi:hypothetical protein
MDNLKQRFTNILQGKDVKIPSRRKKYEDYEEDDEIEESDKEDSQTSDKNGDIDGEIIKLYLLSKMKQQVKSQMKGNFYGKR